MKKLLGLFAATAIVFCLSLGAFAQGKGGGKGNSGGRGNGGGKGSSGSVIGGGDSNRGRGGNDDSISGSKKEKNKNKGNSGVLGDSNSENRGSNRYKGLSKKTGVPQDVLRTRYETEKALNPKLTHGQFVAAHMISKNHKGISTGDILGGLRNGDSIGQILHDRGWDKERIKKERKRIKKEMKKNRDNDDNDFDDDDRDWNF